jgi:competence protein ComEA
VKRNAKALTKAIVCGLVFCGAGMPSYAQQAAPPQPAQPAQHPQYPELPAGPGKDTLVRVCSKCHSPDNVIANGQDRAGWENTITKMAGFGAEASDDEFTEILDYLAKNFPPVTTIHVNQATAEQLESGLGLSTTEAEAVVEYRKKNGDFKSLDDLKKVPDVDAKKLDAKKDSLAF